MLQEQTNPKFSVGLAAEFDFSRSCPLRVGGGLGSIWWLRNPNNGKAIISPQGFHSDCGRGERVGWLCTSPKKLQAGSNAYGSHSQHIGYYYNGLRNEGEHMAIPWVVNILGDMHYLISASQSQEIYQYSFLQRRKQRHREIMGLAPRCHR